MTRRARRGRRRPGRRLREPTGAGSRRPGTPRTGGGAAVLQGDQSSDLEGTRHRGGHQTDVVAGADVGLRGEFGVQDDLSGGAGRVTGGQPEVAEAQARPVVRLHPRAVVSRHRLTGIGHQPHRGAHVRDHRLRSVHAGDPVGRRGPQRYAFGQRLGLLHGRSVEVLEGQFDLLAARDDDVGRRVPLGGGSGPYARLQQDPARAQDGRAQQQGDEGADETALAGLERQQGETQHQAALRRPAMTSATRSALGSVKASTRCPALRKRAWSVCAAATGSWVTMTTV